MSGAPSSSSVPAGATTPAAPKKYDDLKVDEELSDDESTAHSSDEDFLDNASSDDENGWQVDNRILTASSESFINMPGSTIGMKRFAAMIESIEKRALAAEARKIKKKKTAA